jgi:c-di-GMP-binding flagellar brake protein YcgR
MNKQKNALLVDNTEIFNLLKNIQKSKQLISVSFESLPLYCLTILLDVHHDARVLIFDESNPKISDKLIKNKTEAEFSLKLERLPVVFKSKLISNTKKPDILYAHFPDEIYYPQNRRNYRFHTEFMDEINASIVFSANETLNCQLVNISISGLCLRFPNSAAPLLHVDNLIDDIYIKLPNSSGFSVSAKVQFKRYEHSNSNIAVGMQINHRNASTEKAIQQFIYYS